MPAGLVMAGKALVAAGLLVAAGWFALVAGNGPPRAADPPADRRPPSEPASSPLVIPVEGVSPRDLSDTFADARSEGRRHDAIDIMAPRGTPVRAAAAGRVERLFLSQAGGNTVYIRAPGGRLIYYYAHLDRYAAGLREGDALDRGDPIGSVGSSGNADPAAPHLHFAVLATSPDRKWWEPATALNPYPLLAARR